MKNLTRNTLIAATVIGLGVIGANLAAAGPYGGRGNCQNGGYMSQQMGPGAMSYPRGGMGQPMMNPQMRQQRMQQHLGAAEQALNLTAEQQPAWDRFVAARQANAQQMQAQRQAMMAQAGQGPQAMMANRMQFMEQRLERMKQARAELDALYAELTPEQRGIADQVLGPMGGRRPF